MTLSKRLSHLPVKAEELQKWVLVGKAKLSAQIQAIKAINKLESGIAARRAALSDTQDLAEELLYAEARLGEMLEGLDRPKGNLGSRGVTKILPKGIDKKESHFAQRLNRKRDKIAEVVALARAHDEIPLRRHVLTDSLVSKLTSNAENFTPSHIIEKVRLVMGGIDLDPASCEMAQKTVQAKVYFTQKEDGLAQKWSGRVFLNPPYGMPYIRQFTGKLLSELKNIQEAILLTNDQTDTDWWQRCACGSSCFCMPDGRIRFYTPTQEKTSPTNGQTIFYFGVNVGGFCEHFGDMGLIAVVMRANFPAYTALK
jgi:hypothetical protein